MGLLVYFEPESTCIFTRFLTIIVLKLKKFFAKMQKWLFRKYFATLRMVWNKLDNGLAILFRWHYNALPYQSMWLWQPATIELFMYLRRTTYYQRLSLCRGFNLIYWPGHILPRSDRYLILITRLQFFISIKAKNKLQYVCEISKKKK